MAGDARRRGAEVELDPGAAVRRGEEMRGRHRDARPMTRSVNSTICTDLPGPRDRGKFEADKAGADHHHRFGGGEPVAQRLGLGQRAQVAHPIEFDAGQRRHPVAGARGQHEWP